MNTESMASEGERIMKELVARVVQDNPGLDRALVAELAWAEVAALPPEDQACAQVYLPLRGAQELRAGRHHDAFRSAIRKHEHDQGGEA